LPPGSAQLTATYCGSADFAASTSPTQTLTASRATSKTTLALPTARVTYGNEQAEHLAVTVTAQYGRTPGGQVTVKAGTKTVCVIILAAASGSGTLPATVVPAGATQLTASYTGSADIATSTSAEKALTVSRATSNTTLAPSTARLTYVKGQAEHLTVNVTA
jgi:hypothetical protein